MFHSAVEGSGALSHVEGSVSKQALPLPFAEWKQTNHMELSSMDYESELNGFEGTDMKDMRLEAEAVVNDVLFAVNDMFVSKTLRCADDVAYINVETRERARYCLELTEAGLRVVGHAFDQVDDHLQTPYHETVYSLLDTLSPAYREAFGNALLQRLESLQRDG
ncbi:GSK3B-interacting protein [Galemys pyrenaicus]|uniref:GSK3B-interacting protein n=1 Tax=Galemys pyrenaicus TaxID=202257 RepID=A0A8J6AML8_GALPY|nr:GSK3B-interacting protein [Galemys pyrenaicus]